MSDREFVVSTRFYLNSFDFTQFNLNKGPFFNQNKNRRLLDTITGKITSRYSLDGNNGRCWISNTNL